jgi:bacteriocin resistance YdeI/OmpD-like protein
MMRQESGPEADALAAWQDISALARNEWICWVTSARKPETRARRIERASADLMGVNAGHVAGPGARIDEVSWRPVAAGPRKEYALRMRFN